MIEEKFQEMMFEDNFVIKSYNYKIKPIDCECRNKSIILKSKKSLKAEEIFEMASNYYNKNGFLIESIEVNRTNDLEPGFLRAVHSVVGNIIPVEQVYKKIIEPSESLNETEIKNLIDTILSDDISDMIGSSESISTRLKEKLMSLEKKGAKAYRIYKDGVAIDTFIKNVCGIKETEDTLYKENTKETIKSISSFSSSKCNVSLISCEKDYCLVLAEEK